MKINPDEKGPPPPPEKRGPDKADTPPKQFPKIKKKEEKKERGRSVGKREKREGPKQPVKPLGNFPGGAQAAMQAGNAVSNAQGPQAGGAVQKIIQVFQDNKLFEAGGVSQISVGAQGEDTRISVVLENGVSVDINLGAGSQDLNVTITGLTAEIQAIADNPANQAQLETLLKEQGFNLNYITTMRGEGPAVGPGPAAPPAPGPAAAPEAERGEGGERESGGEEGGEPGEEGQQR